MFRGKTCTLSSGMFDNCGDGSDESRAVPWSSPFLCSLWLWLFGPSPRSTIFVNSLMFSVFSGWDSGCWCPNTLRFVASILVAIDSCLHLLLKSLQECAYLSNLSQFWNLLPKVGDGLPLLEISKGCFLDPFAAFAGKNPPCFGNLGCSATSEYV